MRDRMIKSYFAAGKKQCSIAKYDAVNVHQVKQHNGRAYGQCDKRNKCITLKAVYILEANKATTNRELGRGSYLEGVCSFLYIGFEVTFLSESVVNDL